MTRVAVRIAFDHTGTLAKEVAARAAQVRRKVVADLQRDWAAGVRVDTGNLKNSIQTDAHADHIHEQTDGGTVVGTATEYAVYENYGTRNMAGSFALEKAVEKHAGPFEQAMRRVVG